MSSIALDTKGNRIPVPRPGKKLRGGWVIYTDEQGRTVYQQLERQRIKWFRRTSPKK